MDDKQLQIKASAFDNLEKLLGYWQNGTDDIVTIFQDDATEEYIVKLGFVYMGTTAEYFHGPSLIQAINNAAKRFGEQ